MVLPFPLDENAKSGTASRLEIAAAVGSQRRRPICAPFRASSKEHFWALASKFQHPAAESTRHLPADWQFALAFQASHATWHANGEVGFSKLIQRRMSTLKWLYTLERGFADKRSEWLASLDDDVRKGIGHVNVPLLQHLATLYEFPEIFVDRENDRK